MSAGVHQAAPVTISTKVNAQAMVAYREQLKADSADGANSTSLLVPSFSDLLIHWVARALRELPELIACWYQVGIHFYEGIRVAMAVDTPDGLLAPVVRNADRLGLL
jgi:pyruvate dehydrogenase E2 component (dihydrolipoamide acetyltransferase)